MKALFVIVVAIIVVIVVSYVTQRRRRRSSVQFSVPIEGIVLQDSDYDPNVVVETNTMEPGLLRTWFKHPGLLGRTIDKETRSNLDPKYTWILYEFQDSSGLMHAINASIFCAHDDLMTPFDSAYASLTSPKHFWHPLTSQGKSSVKKLPYGIQGFMKVSEEVMKVVKAYDKALNGSHGLSPELSK